jgi:hypothetical protein
MPRRPQANSAFNSRPTTDIRPSWPGLWTPGVLGAKVKIACLEDVTQGRLWAYGDPRRRLSKRKKDELDLIRLAEAYPSLKSCYPAELREQLGRG